MIPIYATISFLSYRFYAHAIYWETIRDCYEAFAIASFFALLCNYIEPTLHKQKQYFKTIKPKNWVLPLNWFQCCTGGQKSGLLRIPRSGLTWFNIIWVGVFQYCLVRVLCTFAALITALIGRYCEESLSPAFGHVWVLGIDAVAVTIAMYCLIQFYYQLREDLAPNKPFLKVCCIKLVIFFSFWQNVSNCESLWRNSE
jgi:organic solute transporter Ostalpha